MLQDRLGTRGFTLMELLLTAAIAATLMAIAVPIFGDLTESSRLNTATRDVERELQTARLKAVSANTTLRVRINCPAAGQVRIVEWIGSPAIDDAGNRCNDVAYPYPAPDTDILTEPNNDGPIRRVAFGTTLSTAIIEFRPDGTAREVVGGVVQSIAGTVGVTVTRASGSKTVQVNALGKINIQ